MRLRDVVARLEKSILLDQLKRLPRPIGAHRFERDRRCLRQRSAGCGTQPEDRRNAVFEDAQLDLAVSGIEDNQLTVRGVVVVVVGGLAQLPARAKIHPRRQRENAHRRTKLKIRLYCLRIPLAAVMQGGGGKRPNDERVREGGGKAK